MAGGAAQVGPEEVNAEESVGGEVPSVLGAVDGGLKPVADIAPAGGLGEITAQIRLITCNLRGFPTVPFQGPTQEITPASSCKVSAPLGSSGL